jgi:predicted ATPase/class 3 adenylate cyclase/GNAT superfamily N-acetyltransferase
VSGARDLPRGSVTFLFTDIEGSTRLLDDLGPEPYAEAVAEHRRILRDAFAAQGGVEVDTQGDAFFVAFPTPEGALAAAAAAREGLADSAIRVRMGIHTGTPLVAEEGYVGPDVHLGARIAAAGHGGQVLVSMATRELVAADLTDLGEHRLKDFDEPVLVYQLGSEAFPPLKTISNTNLPRPASSFIGREPEVAELASMLRDGVRLLTLTGPGGSGKTRLAIEAAADLVDEFKAGVFWFGLAPLRDPALVTAAVAQTLGATKDLVQHIGEREMLLLLDNLEQVIDAGPDLATMVEACPNLRLLVTSRERLRVRGEVEYPVAPLADPDAVALFCARAGLEPDATAAELCRRLDNLPLAVELAAARSSVLTPEEVLGRIAERLDLLRGGRDADARQQTLRATIGWSYELLTVDEQRLFARMSVFAGGCGLESALAVVDADLDTLQSLVDKSLIRHTDGRFWMLETIRDFAAERLEDRGEREPIRRRHAEHFLAVAEKAEPNLLGGSEQERWLDGLERDIDNFRAAIDHDATSGDIQHAMALAGALAELWDQRGHQVEALRRYQALLAADERPTVARSKALSGASMEATKAGDIQLALRYGGEELELHRRFGNRHGEAMALWLFGYLHTETGELSRAEHELQESVRLFGELGDELLQAWAARALALHYLRRGNLARARLLYEENLRRAQAAGDAGLETASLDALASIAVREDRRGEAAALMQEALQAARSVGDVLFVTANICTAAEVLAGLGRPLVAATLLGFALARYEELGTREPWVEHMNKETLDAIERQLDPPTVGSATEAGRHLSLEDARGLALSALAEDAPAGSTDAASQ